MNVKYVKWCVCSGDFSSNQCPPVCCWNTSIVSSSSISSCRHYNKDYLNLAQEIYTPVYLNLTDIQATSVDVYTHCGAPWEGEVPTIMTRTDNILTCVGGEIFYNPSYIFIWGKTTCTILSYDCTCNPPQMYILHYTVLIDL